MNYETEQRLHNIVESFGWTVKSAQSTTYRNFVTIESPNQDWQSLDAELSDIKWKLSLLLKHETRLIVVAPALRKKSTHILPSVWKVEQRGEPVGKPSRRSTRRF